MRRPDPMHLALAAALASGLGVVACGSSEGAPTDAGAPDLGTPDTGTDAGPPMPEGPAKRLFAKRFVVKVHARPDRDAERLGYLRAGVVIDATTSGPVATEGCREGWYELSSGGGYVCNGRDVTAFDGRRLPARPPAQPDFDAPVPYAYGRTRRDLTPMYRRLPTDEEAAQFEGYRIPGVEPVPTEAVEGAPSPAPAPPLDEGGVELAASGPALSAATEGDPEAPVEPLVPTLASLEGERGSVLMRRVLRGFIVSLDRDLRTGARRYWRTLSNGFVPYFAISQPIDGSDFRGVLLDPPAAAGGEDAGIDAGLDAGIDAGRRRRAAPAPPPALRLPIGWVTSSKTAGYVRGPNGRPRRARAPGYHVMFPVVSEEIHGDEPYVVAHDGALFRLRDVAVARAATERPDGVQEGERWIDVNLAQQTLVAYEDLTPVFATLISSGRVRDPEDPLATFATPTGLFRITSKHVTHTMDGDHAVDGPYSIEDVPYVMYFQLAYALHSAFWHNGFGHPRSHGCVNLAPLDARWLFGWATPTLPAGWHAIFPTDADPGTWVWIHGETPGG
jgi:hypothetical protein